MGNWGISDSASDVEKVKSRFNDFLKGLNCVGEITYSTYCEIYDFGMSVLGEMYELGKKEGVGSEDK